MRNVRDALLTPLTEPLTSLKITAHHLSILHVIIMAGFALTVPYYPLSALGLLIISLSLDALDGALARVQGTAGRLGKYIDRIADSVALTLYVVGLNFAHLIDLRLAAIYLLISLSTLPFRQEFSWANGLLYFSFPLLVLTDLNIFGYLLPICIALTALELIVLAKISLRREVK